MTQSESQLEERRRKYDERWMQEVLSGLSRIHIVLCDVSEVVQKMVEYQRDLQVESRAPFEPERLMLNLKEAAEALGLSQSAVRANVPVTKVGSRVMFQRVDIDKFLAARRDTPFDEHRLKWRPGAIGTTMPKPPTTAAQRGYCEGSGDEPARMSEYSGRGICRLCGDHVLLTKSGMTRKHEPMNR